jgi:hypothetical protein
MKKFKQKAMVINRLQDELDDHIWKVFDRYIKIKRILFNSPDDWKIDDPCNIGFSGSDGCMGCYDNMSISIPMKYFENPDEEFEKLQKDVEKEFIEKKRKHARNKKAQEKRELKRLKEKYEGG